jgi:hypothetical protein
LTLSGGRFSRFNSRRLTGSGTALVFSVGVDDDTGGEGWRRIRRRRKRAWRIQGGSWLSRAHNHFTGHIACAKYPTRSGAMSNALKKYSACLFLRCPLERLFAQYTHRISHFYRHTGFSAPAEQALLGLLGKGTYDMWTNTVSESIILEIKICFRKSVQGSI